MFDKNKSYLLGDAITIDGGQTVVRRMKYVNIPAAKLVGWVVEEEVSDEYGFRVGFDYVAINIDENEWQKYVLKEAPEVIKTIVVKKPSDTYEPITKDDLTYEQHRLKTYLDSIYPKGATKEQICDVLSSQYPRHEEDSNEHNSTAFNLIRRDFKALKDSVNIDEVYACVGTLYKRLSSEELKAYFTSEWPLVIAKIKRLKKQEKKAKLDGQARIDFDYHGEITKCFEEVN